MDTGVDDDGDNQQGTEEEPELIHFSHSFHREIPCVYSSSSCCSQASPFNAPAVAASTTTKRAKINPVVSLMFLFSFHTTESCSADNSIVWL